MNEYTAAQAAAKLDTTAKILRRFLRSEPVYTNAGSGGRYIFRDDDMPQLETLFTAWLSRSKRNRPTALISDTHGLPINIVRSRHPRDRATVARMSRERVDRLEQALYAKGLHISQMRDRETFRSLQPAG